MPEHTPAYLDAAADAAATVLADHPDYRILRRLRDAAQLASPAPANTPTRVAAVVDVETTGLDAASNRIIELAIQRFRFTAPGQITEVGLARSWREDPGFPLDPTITKLTGLTDADVAGQAINDVEATAMLASADVIIAHNAKFDAKFVEARLPAVAGQAWACTLNEIAWPEHGFAGRQLGHLLMEAGYFFAGHRAAEDVLALIFLLAHRPHDGAPLLANLIARAEQPAVRIDAIGADYDSKDLLKARGYRWEATGRYWSIEVPEHAAEAEQLWLQHNACRHGARMTRVTWRERHR
jgi:DNA polymerase-3 subunit epsilon